MSCDDTSRQEVPRAKLSFTMDERRLLLTLVSERQEAVSNKKLDMKSVAQKNEAWEAINAEFSRHKVARSVRTPQQLKRCWENIKAKAKRGDRLSQKLLRWEERRKKALEKADAQKEDDYESDTDLDEDSSDSSLPSLKRGGAVSEFAEVDTNVGSDEEVGKSLKQLAEVVNSNSCQHCQCDKKEKMTRMELLLLEKRRKDALYKLKVQNLRAKSKRERHLYLLAVQELTTKVANEKKKSEILEKEISQYGE